MREGRPVAELIAGLPPDYQEQVREFVDALIARQQPRKRRPSQFVWAGALKELRDKYTAVDLQHEISRGRG